MTTDSKDGTKTFRAQYQLIHACFKIQKWAMTKQEKMTVACNKWTPTHRCTFKPNPRKKERTKKDTKYAPTQNNTHRHSHTLSNTHTHTHTHMHTHWPVKSRCCCHHSLPQTCWGYARCCWTRGSHGETGGPIEQSARSNTAPPCAGGREKRWLTLHSYPYFFQHRTFPMLRDLGHLFPWKVTSVILKTMLVSQVRLQ